MPSRLRRKHQRLQFKDNHLRIVHSTESISLSYIWLKEKYIGWKTFDFADMLPCFSPPDQDPPRGENTLRMHSKWSRCRSLGTRAKKEGNSVSISTK
jgi:hypothetical protein